MPLPCELCVGQSGQERVLCPGAPALLREAQWVIGPGLSSELPTQFSGPRPASASGLGVGVHLLSSCLNPQP